jgi:hypothetical protein
VRQGPLSGAGLKLSDAEWERVKGASGLPNNARSAVDKTIAHYRIRKSRGAVEDPTKKMVARASELASELSNLLVSIAHNDEYRFFSRASRPVSAKDLLDARAALVVAQGSLDSAQRRFVTRNRRNWKIDCLQLLVIHLLDLRVYALDVHVPLSETDTSTSGPFVKYLKVCALLADPTLTPLMIRAGIKKAMIAFRKLQPHDPGFFDPNPVSS